MEKRAFCLALVCFFGAVVLVSAYSDAEILWYIQKVPEEERPTFLRYAVIRGYELTTGESSDLEIPNYQYRGNTKLLKAIYEYFLENHSVSDIIQYPYPMDIICFPQGCIEIDDPGIHP